MLWQNTKSLEDFKFNRCSTTIQLEVTAAERLARVEKQIHPTLRISQRLVDTCQVSKVDEVKDVGNVKMSIALEKWHNLNNWDQVYSPMNFTSNDYTLVFIRTGHHLFNYWQCLKKFFWLMRTGFPAGQKLKSSSLVASEVQNSSQK